MGLSSRTRRCALALLLASAACGGEVAPAADSPTDAGGVADTPALACGDRFLPHTLTTPVEPPDGPDPRVGRDVVYELQVRTANACDPLRGSQAQRERCVARVAPEMPPRALDSRCSREPELARIRPGLLDDLLVPTDDPADGVSLAWIRRRVGAGVVWLMPVFPLNDRLRLPNTCDTWGSPYAVRDYFHVRGSLAASCVDEGRDSFGRPFGPVDAAPDGPPCWADAAFDDVIAEADVLGLRIWLDVAFNHFGHDYLTYDLAGYVDPLVWIERAGARTPDDALRVLRDWNATFDPALAAPRVLDRFDEQRLDEPTRAAWDELRARCPDAEAWDDDARARAVSAWRLALPWERPRFACDDLRLEASAPGFYLSADGRSPSTGPGDDFTRDWRDVKFLYLRDDADALPPFDEPTGLSHAFLTRVRNREYLTRILILWSSRGVGGYRLDHASDTFSGLDADDWQYILGKVAWYEARQGRPRPLILAEEFHAQEATASIADAMTEGWLFDMAGRGGVEKSVAWAEDVLRRMGRHRQRVRVMTALENHDELRLVQDTGLDPWSGLGFWALGAATWSMPMLLVGQEWGASERLAFRMPSILPGRFEGEPGWRDDRDALVAAYREVIDARALLPALQGTGMRALRRGDGQPNDGVLSLLRWDDAGNHALLLHNFWASSALVEVALTEPVASGLGMDACGSYRLEATLGEAPSAGCRTGRAWAEGVRFHLGPGQRVVWARWVPCDP